MLIAQITDFHVAPTPSSAKGGLDTNRMLTDAIEHVNGLDPRPDVVLATGDLTEGGSVDAYARLREILAKLEPRVLLIPGNHDSRANLIGAFPDHDYLPQEGFLHYTVDDYPVRLVALDTTLPGRSEGRLCPERLAWLDERLMEQPERPTLIFMHHPPFETGIWWMDASGLGGARGFRDVLARHPQVARVVCGHLHRAIQAAWGHTVVSVAPSTCYQVHLDLVPESRPHAVLEPPACQLHHFTGEFFVSHTSYVNWGSPPIDLSPAMGDWSAVRDELRARKRAIDAEA